MPVEVIVAGLLCGVQSHKARVLAVAAAVLAVLYSRRLSAAWMGRFFPGKSAKHAIKRFDRLIGNMLLAAELPQFYRAICDAFAKRSRLILLVDWTHLYGPFHALAVSMVVRGRSVILLGEVHHERNLGNPKVQSAFLRQLHALLPHDARPVVVSDAGFHGDFFRTVSSLGWDFVGRIRGTAQLRCDGKLRTKAELYALATRCARDFPLSALYAHNSFPCRLVLARRPHTKRRSKPTTNKELIQYRKSARDPWLLATSLSPECHSAESVIDTYGTRMQIEESFRDAKSGRFGLGLGQTRARTRERHGVQLLLAALALAAALLLGLDAEERKLHLQLQANSIKTRRVLSLVRLGLEIVRRLAHRYLDVATLRSLLHTTRLLSFRGDP
jgi:Transposase DDE domain